jgi:hypothetical protein
VSAFAKKVELYPVGSFIELSNGKIAIVLSSASPLRPVVRLIETGDIVDLYRDRQYFSVVINRILPDLTLPG